jgi:hypothetical protein
MFIEGIGLMSIFLDHVFQFTKLYSLEGERSEGEGERVRVRG